MQTYQNIDLVIEPLVGPTDAKASGPPTGTKGRTVLGDTEPQISDEVALAFSQEFYGALADGWSMLRRSRPALRSSRGSIRSKEAHRSFIHARRRAVSWTSLPDTFQVHTQQ